MPPDRPPTPPMRLRLCTPSPSTNVSQGHGSILVQNDPYSREYHMQVTSATNAPLYDLPARCEPRGAIVLPVTRTGLLGLTLQYRPVPTTHPAHGSYPLDEQTLHARGAWSLEFPRGFPEPGESGLHAARREAEEELGASVLAARSVAWLNFNTSWMLNDIPLYAALVDPDGGRERHVESGEHVREVRWLRPEQVQQAVASGDIRCAITLAALSHAMCNEAVLASLRVEGKARAAAAALVSAAGDMFQTVETAAAELWEVGVDVGELSLLAVVAVARDADAMQTALEALGGAQKQTLGKVEWPGAVGAYDLDAPIVAAGLEADVLLVASGGGAGGVVMSVARGAVPQFVKRYERVRFEMQGIHVASVRLRGVQVRIVELAAAAAPRRC